MNLNFGNEALSRALKSQEEQMNNLAETLKRSIPDIKIPEFKFPGLESLGDCPFEAKSSIESG